MITLGIDTSNYTTSCALYDSDSGKIIHRKKLLPVKEGEKGLRQSDAVFHHTQQLYPLIDDLMNSFDGVIDAVGVSSKPRDVEGSYMPCFTVGINTASAISSVIGKPLFMFSHQAGHILSALYSSDSLSLISERFIAFHVSGGTTEALLVEPSADSIITERIIGFTEDINCGQAIDRCGVMLGMGFPCGPELEKYALLSTKKFTPKVCVRNGNCSLSGLENICKKMYENGEPKQDISAFCLEFICRTLEKMTDSALDKFGKLPIVYAGGVMSDKIIRDRLASKYNAVFASPEFSSDNAAGTAILTYLKVND